MNEPKVLILMNDSIKSKTLVVGDKKHEFTKTNRWVIIDDESKYKHLVGREYSIGNLDDSELLKWYRLNAKPQKKEVMTVDQMIAELKANGYIVYKSNKK